MEYPDWRGRRPGRCGRNTLTGASRTCSAPVRIFNHQFGEGGSVAGLKPHTTATTTGGDTCHGLLWFSACSLVYWPELTHPRRPKTRRRRRARRPCWTGKRRACQRPSRSRAASTTASESSAHSRTRRGTGKLLLDPNDADAGTAFDGTHLYQIAEARIDKIDPVTGDIVASIPAPGQGGDWVDVGRGQPVGGAVSRPQDPPDRPGDRRHRANHRVEPLRHRRDLGRRRALALAARTVTRAISVASTPRAATCWSGFRCRTESSSADSSPSGANLFYCGGGSSGKVRAVRRPKGKRA